MKVDEKKNENLFVFFGPFSSNIFGFNMYSLQYGPRLMIRNKVSI